MKKVVLGLLLFTVLPVNAASFGNGDFSAGSALWNDVSGSGSVSFIGAEAVLETGTDVDSFSAVMIQGDEGSFSFNNPISLAGDVALLHFDAMFDVLGADGSESGSGFADALFVSLYDAIDFNLDLLFDPLIDSALDGVGFISYVFDVSALQGRDIALSFELADENDGVNSRVTLDNVRFSSLPTVSVPAPSVLILLLVGGLPLVRPFYKKNRI